MTATRRLAITATSPDTGHHIAWDPTRLTWVLTLHDQTLATIHGYLPSQPPTDQTRAQHWANQILNTTLDWRRPTQPTLIPTQPTHTATNTPVPETTPGYSIALAAAYFEGHQAYVHQLATELIETAETPKTSQETAK
ncbi:hypothetical protein [Streptomyces sp. NPDC058297]|uniref:hypothetical protein n=1 Tax=Streptomyces sp. NPDC058297 TaxID=3346433 RepID=UPI0036F0D602